MNTKINKPKVEEIFFLIFIILTTLACIIVIISGRTFIENAIAIIVLELNTILFYVMKIANKRW